MIDREFVMLDLFAGLGGASAAMRGLPGWRVVTVDFDQAFEPDYCVDLLSWLPPVDLVGRVDLLWASPPCTEFSRYIQRGVFRNEPLPSMALYNATLLIIDFIKPRYWQIENVRGACRFFGDGYISYGSYYVWGNVPALPVDRRKAVHVKSGVTVGNKRRAAERAKVPYEISAALKYFVENQMELFDRSPFVSPLFDPGSKLVRSSEFEHER